MPRDSEAFFHLFLFFFSLKINLRIGEINLGELNTTTFKALFLPVIVFVIKAPRVR